MLKSDGYLAIKFHHLLVLWFFKSDLNEFKYHSVQFFLQLSTLLFKAKVKILNLLLASYWEFA